MPLKIHLYSDFACPYCFVAEQSTVPKLLSEYDVAVDWRGFELHAEMPVGGMPLAERFGAERIPGMQRSIERFASGFGVEPFKLNGHLPNTRWALALAELARERGRLDEYRRAASHGYWRRGLNLESARDMAIIAEEAGLPAGAPKEAISESGYLAKVATTAQEFDRRGATGIPAFFIGGERIVGCVPYEQLAAAVERAGGVRRGAAAPG